MPTSEDVKLAFQLIDIIDDVYYNYNLHTPNNIIESTSVWYAHQKCMTFAIRLFVVNNQLCK